MNKILQTDSFDKWFRKLRDKRAQGRIKIRIDRMKMGNLGDARSVGGSVSEIRIDYGPGYRLYFVRKDCVILLVGGNKKTQQKDIKNAKSLAQSILEGKLYEQT